VSAASSVRPCRVDADALSTARPLSPLKKGKTSFHPPGAHPGHCFQMRFSCAFELERFPFGLVLTMSHLCSSQWEAALPVRVGRSSWLPTAPVPVPASRTAISTTATTSRPAATGSDGPLIRLMPSRVPPPSSVLSQPRSPPLTYMSSDPALIRLVSFARGVRAADACARADDGPREACYSPSRRREAATARAYAPSVRK
jgi:hypothetical protein